MTSPDLPTILEEKGGLRSCLYTKIACHQRRTHPKYAIQLAVQLRLPCLPCCIAVRSLQYGDQSLWCALETGSHLLVQHLCCTSSVLTHFPRTFAFKSIRDCSNVKLATTIPFASAAITIWTINQLYLELHRNFRFFFLVSVIIRIINKSHNQTSVLKIVQI